jgi:hypothetical protein
MSTPGSGGFYNSLPSASLKDSLAVRRFTWQPVVQVRFVSGHAFTGCGKTLIRVETGLAPSQTAEELWFERALGRARLHRLRKKSGFVSGYRFSDTVSPSKSDAPLGAGQGKFTFSAASSGVPQVH